MLRPIAALVLIVLSNATASAQYPLAGTWPQGAWQASNSRHHGPLHARFTPINDSQYRVHFGGRFAKIIPFRYQATLDVVATDGCTTYLSGLSRLPLFGTFIYDAVATPTSFHATYQHRRYQGTFFLAR